MATPTLDDPDYARFAWRRYRQILKWMALASLAAALVALGWMHWFGGGLTIALAIGTAGAVGFTVFVAAALMGLVFLSSGTGHDEEVDRAAEEDFRIGPKR